MGGGGGGGGGGGVGTKGVVRWYRMKVGRDGLDRLHKGHTSIPESYVRKLKTRKNKKTYI